MQVALIAQAELGSTIKRLHRSHRYLCAIQSPVTERVAVYASETQGVDALTEARTDYPHGVVLGEYEYLSQDAIAALLAVHADPRAEGMRHLGRVIAPA